MSIYDPVTMKTEIDPFMFYYRVYGDDPDEYIANCVLYKYGDVAILSGMHGNHLLKNLFEDLVDGKLKEMGIKTLEGYVIRPVAVACKRVARSKGGTAEVTKTCTENGRDFQWIVVQAGE